MATRNSRNTMSRLMAKGFYDPASSLIKDEEAAVRRAKIRDSFEVLIPGYQKPAPGDEEIAAMPMRVSGVRSIPYSKTLDMYTLADIRPYHPDNGRHRDNFRQRSSLKNLFQEQAYETWTSPFFGHDRVE